MKTQKLIKTDRGSYAAKYSGRRRARVWLIAAALGGLFIIPAGAAASTLISEGFLANGSPPAGSIVSLQKDSSDYVNPATDSNSTNLLGVIISNENSQVSLSSGQSNQVQVATNGIEQVLVSNINGNIQVGDPITASPISGVGMKTTSNAEVIGVAQDVFPNSTSSQQPYVDKNHKTHTVMLGEVPVLVNVAYYYKQPVKTLIPAAIQNIADALAGKTVNSLPILISMGIFIVTLVIVVSIIYAMIHSSIISVGRNPMSQAAIYRNIIQLSILVVIILGVAVLSIYMVLARF